MCLFLESLTKRIWVLISSDANFTHPRTEKLSMVRQTSIIPWSNWYESFLLICARIVAWSIASPSSTDARRPILTSADLLMAPTRTLSRITLTELYTCRQAVQLGYVRQHETLSDSPSYGAASIGGCTERLRN